MPENQKRLSAPLFSREDMERHGLKYDFSETSPSLHLIESQNGGKNRNKNSGRRHSSPRHHNHQEDTTMSHPQTGSNNKTDRSSSRNLPSGSALPVSPPTTEFGVLAETLRAGLAPLQKLDTLNESIDKFGFVMSAKIDEQSHFLNKRNLWTSFRHAVVQSGVLAVVGGLAVLTKVIFFSPAAAVPELLPVVPVAKKL